MFVYLHKAAVIRLSVMTNKSNLVLKKCFNDILTCHSRKSTGVIKNVNDGNSREHLNGIQSSLIVLITPVLFLQVKLSAVKKVFI